jgi:hypothetical protein
LGELASTYQEYKQIPNTARYGRLRGMWVRREIYDDIMGIHDLLPQDASWFQNVFGYGGVGTRITQIWKAAKVSLNPPAQVRNFVSNMVMLQLSGIYRAVYTVRFEEAVFVLHCFQKKSKSGIATPKQDMEIFAPG